MHFHFHLNTKDTIWAIIMTKLKYEIVLSLNLLNDDIFEIKTQTKRLLISMCKKLNVDWAVKFFVIWHRLI